MKKDYENGSALIISLIILLIMTILGIQGLQGSTLQEKMSGNYRDRSVAFEAAEAGLRSAETWLNLQSEMPLANNNGSENIWSLGAADLTDNSFWQSHGIEAATTMTVGSGSISQAPLFIIEERTEVSNTGMARSAATGVNDSSTLKARSISYRITARGTGTTENSVVYLQTNFVKVYN